MTSVKETERNIISPATETNKLNTHTSFNKAKISFNKIETKTDLKKQINVWMSFMKREFTLSAINVLETFPVKFCHSNAVKKKMIKL